MRKENPGIKTKSITRVQEKGYGCYVWKLPSGRPLMDDDYNMLSIDAWYGDFNAMAKLRQAAIYWGYPDGEPQFVKGFKCTDQEYQDWINRGEDV